jgi:3-methyladenine DNA glycosylase AlkD
MGASIPAPMIDREGEGLVRRILRDLRAAGSAKRRARQEWYYPSGVPSFTASRAAFAAADRALRAHVRGKDGAAVLALAKRLVAERVREPLHLAWVLLDRRPDALEEATARDLRALEHGLDNWAAVDSFSVQVLGRAWLLGRLPDAAIRRRAASRDLWIRRSALVATVPLNQRSRGGRGDARRTLAVCALLLDDREDMVVKAMSWALRELAKREPAPVRAFLARHGDRVAARARREVRNKLRTGLKNPRRPG